MRSYGLGAELCRRIGSLILSYYMIFIICRSWRGNIIENIRKYHPYFSHVHTGGSPGRAEIDETQELYYPAIIKALMETGYKGSLGRSSSPPKKTRSLPWRSVSVSVMYRAI